MSDLIEPEPYSVPDYYKISPRSEKPKAAFTGQGWEVGIYKRGPRMREVMDEPVYDKADLGTGSETKGTKRIYWGFRFALQKVVPALEISLTSTIDEPNTATVTLPLGGEPEGVLRGEVYPYDTVIEVVYNGFSMFAGIAWTCRADFAAQSLTINAGDFLSFQKYRTSDRARFDGYNNQKGNMDVVDALWCCAMRSSNLNAGIHSAIWVDPKRKDVEREVTFEYGQFNTVLDLLYTWADNRDGFYLYDAPVRVGPSNINHTMKGEPENDYTGRYPDTVLIPQVSFTKSREPVQLKVPSAGGALKPLTLVDRENCEVTDLLIDASTYANISTAVGTPGQLNNNRQAKEWRPWVTEWSPGMDPNDGSKSPVPIKNVVTRHSIRIDPEDEHGRVNLALLADKAKIQLNRSKEPAIIPTVRIYPDQIHPGFFRQANMGQYLRLESRTNDYAQIDNDYMIVGSTIKAEKDGSSIVDLDLVQKSKFEVPIS
ncbi:hypothetical protein ACN20G_29910 (plasmid) [Streptomyces sp. BI20]|uniref:hypothetical protein n=1 Tax=Streptomyces sp. BI20 TaxID=3403460 RepID=UPI003C770236